MYSLMREKERKKNNRFDSISDFWPYYIHSKKYQCEFNDTSSVDLIPMQCLQFSLC